MNRFLLNLLVISILYHPLAERALASPHCNDAVDKVLNQLKEDKEFFHEPYPIPNGKYSFGMYNVEGGHVLGFNTLHRDGDVVPFSKDGTTHLKVHLAAGELSIQCSLKRKVFHIGKAIEVKADIPLVEIELEVAPQPDGSNPKIVDFNIEDVKGLKVQTTNLGPITNVLYSVFLQLLSRFFKTMIRNSIEENLSTFLADKVKDFTVPLECMNDAYDFM